VTKISVKNILVGCAVVGVGSIAISWIFYKNLPYKLIVKHEYHEVERIVEKEVVKEVVKEKKDVKTTITETPDGTKVTVIEDKTVTDTQVDKETDRDENRTIVEKETRIEQKGLPSWRVDGGVSIDPFTGKQTFQGSINHRIFGPFWFGVTGDSKGTLGFNLGFQF